MSIALVDNDVLLKTVSYGLASALLQAQPFEAQSFHVLGTAKFVIASRLKRRPPQRGTNAAQAEFDALLGQVGTLEPSTDETTLAAKLEYFATTNGLELNGGESLLCAILLVRGYDYLFTGDKRAIQAISRVISQQEWQTLAGRVRCLEQIFMTLLSTNDPAQIRSAVCTEPLADKALAICFACKSPQATPQTIAAGLLSYIRDIAVNSPGAIGEVC